jgi:hypothetical protein
MLFSSLEWEAKTMIRKFFVLNSLLLFLAQVTPVICWSVEEREEVLEEKTFLSSLFDDQDRVERKELEAILDDNLSEFISKIRKSEKNSSQKVQFNNLRAALGHPKKTFQFGISQHQCSFAATTSLQTTGNSIAQKS